MTTVEMMYEFQSLLESALPAYKDELRLDSDKILMQLNIGYRRFMLERYLSTPNTKTNAVTIQDHKDELYDLIEIVDLPAVKKTTGSFANIGYEVDFPTDYYYYIRSDVEINRLDNKDKLGSGYVNVELVDSYSTLENSKATVFNTPIIRKPLSFIYKNKLMIIVDKYTTIKTGNSCTLMYLKQPKNLGLTASTNVTTVPEIAESLHEEIVKYSYQLFMSNISFSNRVNKPSNDN